MRELGVAQVVVVLMAMLAGAAASRANAQAAALPSIQTRSLNEDSGDRAKGRKLLGAMVAALGGYAWLDRQTWVFDGRTAAFYEGQPDEGAPMFEEFHRAEPYAERVVTISHYGALIAKDHADVADVWTGSNGYEITYKGTTPLPPKDVAEHRRRRQHSLEAVVQDWLKQPGVLATYEGEEMVERHLAEQVSVVSGSDDAVTLEIDESSHLPLSLSFKWRDPVYKDWNTDAEEFADYHRIQGIMTPYAITELHNGDLTGERFLTKAVYNTTLPAELFDPNQPLKKK